MRYTRKRGGVRRWRAARWAVPRAKKNPPVGVGVEILASIYAHHHDTGKQFTIQDAADMLGVSWQALDAWISMVNEPSLELARRLAKFMGLTLDELAGLYYKSDLSGILAPQSRRPKSIHEPGGAEFLRGLTPVDAPASAEAPPKRAKRAATGGRRRPEK